MMMYKKTHQIGRIETSPKPKKTREPSVFTNGLAIIGCLHLPLTAFLQGRICYPDYSVYGCPNSHNDKQFKYLSLFFNQEER